MGRRTPVHAVDVLRQLLEVTPRHVQRLAVLLLHLPRYPHQRRHRRLRLRPVLKTLAETLENAPKTSAMIVRRTVGCRAVSRLGRRGRRALTTGESRGRRRGIDRTAVRPPDAQARHRQAASNISISTAPAQSAYRFGRAEAVPRAQHLQRPPAPLLLQACWRCRGCRQQRLEQVLRGLNLRLITQRLG